MAERAVLVRRCSDGRYDVDCARWGGTDRALTAVIHGFSPNRLPDVTWQRWRVGVDFAALVADLDYLQTSACFRVRGPETTVFLPLWFGLPLVDETAAATAGALVAVDSLADARALRTRFRTLKGALADALVAGHLPPAGAPSLLSAWLGCLADREVHVAPPFATPSEG